MAVERAPFAVRAVPNKGQRQLAQTYELCDFFTEERRERYLDWLAAEERTLAMILGYKPLSTQLKKRVAMALAWEPEFDSHLLSKGIANFDDSERVKLLTKLGAAILVTHYYDNAEDAKSDGQQ